MSSKNSRECTSLTGTASPSGFATWLNPIAGVLSVDVTVRSDCGDDLYVCTAGASPGGTPSHPAGADQVRAGHQPCMGLFLSSPPRTLFNFCTAFRHDDVSCGWALAFLLAPFLLFDRAAGFLPPRPQISDAAVAQKLSRPAVASPSRRTPTFPGRALTASSTAADWMITGRKSARLSSGVPLLVFAGVVRFVRVVGSFVEECERSERSSLGRRISIAPQPCIRWILVGSEP